MAWQSAHRIICFLYKDPDDVEKLLHEKYDASHVCHLSKCLNLDHIVIETHDENMDRRQCEGRVDVVNIVDGHIWLLPCPLQCPHNPQCINQRELRERVECKQAEREEEKVQEQQQDADVICLD